MRPARLIFPALRWRARGPAEVWPEVRASLDLGVSGFVVFGGTMSDMRELVEAARRYAGRPILFAADLERGAGQQLPDATPFPPALALAAVGPDAVTDAARTTAREAAAAGIDWVLAPVADLDVEPENPIVGTRSFGREPERVGDRVAEWIRAAEREGVLACAKHYPGHGRTRADSHAELPVVSADATVLAADLQPFRSAIDAGVQSVMLAHVAYPVLDASGTPASLSSPIVSGLRTELGFDGLVATDALIMDAIAESGRTETEAAVEAVRAGTDALLYPHDAGALVPALAGAVEAGELDRSRIGEAAERIERAVGRTRTLPEALPDPRIARERAFDLARRSVRAVRGSGSTRDVGTNLRMVRIDDDLEPPADRDRAAPGGATSDRRVFQRELESRGLSVQDLTGSLDETGPSNLQVDAVVLFCDVRAWKGRAGPGPKTLERTRRALENSPDALLVLFGHPRLAESLPDVESVLCGWSGDPLMQRATAARLTELL